MGTETSNTAIPNKFCGLVKLNNPLMGTETYNLVNRLYIFCSMFVKLNNPLMGTETTTNLYL